MKSNAALRRWNKKMFRNNKMIQLDALQNLQNEISTTHTYTLLGPISSVDVWADFTTWYMVQSSKLLHFHHIIASWDRWIPSICYTSLKINLSDSLYLILRPRVQCKQTATLWRRRGNCSWWKTKSLSQIRSLQFFLFRSSCEKLGIWSLTKPLCRKTRTRPPPHIWSLWIKYQSIGNWCETTCMNSRILLWSDTWREKLLSFSNDSGSQIAKHDFPEDHPKSSYSNAQMSNLWWE